MQNSSLYLQPSPEEVEAQLDHDLMPAYGLVRTAPVAPVVGGTLNWNFRVETSVGPVFARRYRRELDVVQVQAEHDLLAWVADRDVPVAEPMRASDGATVRPVGESIWSLSPWVAGATLVRGETDATGAATLGQMHGRIHGMLLTHPASRHASGFDLRQATRVEVASRLAQVRAAAVDRGLAVEVIAAIDEQAQLAARFLPDEPEGVDDLVIQYTHGDYHNDQVLMAGGADVTAVVDWEMHRVQPRITELIRSIAFSQIIGEPILVAAYLESYGEQIRLTEAECRAGVELWWRGRLRNTWAYEAFLFQGNDRVQVFFPALIKDLRRLADQSWRESFVDQFIRLTCSRARET